MQKSKSSSNVGQFVTRKILKRRSKSQSRSSTQTPFSKWEPAENFTWASENGDRLLIQDSCLQNLTDIEAKILRRVALEKISELNIGANVLLDNDGKQQKRRVLPKKKAITTSFFDISKKEDQSGGNGIFGNSLECCLINDKKRNLKEWSERGSRNSIASLFRSGSGSESSSKLHENVRSYERLPLSTFSLASPHGGDNSIDSGRASGSKSGCGYFGSISKFTSMQTQISRSQSDIRRRSQDFDLQRFKVQDCTDFKEPHERSENLLQVPKFISSCIKYLEEYGLHMVGLFRVSTSKKRVKQMREHFDKNSMTAIKAETCPHDVATLLKEFLRDLPDPLLCSGLYKAFLETQKIRNRRLQLEAISHLVKLLPVAHRDTLYVLLKFLAKVASCSDDVPGHGGNTQISGNKMDSNNLATVFAPNILRTSLKSLSNTAIADIAACGNSNEQESMSDAINVIRIMIDHYEEIFKVPAALIDIVYSHMLDESPEDLYCLCEQRCQSLREDIGNYCASLSSPEQIISPPPTTVALSTKVTTKRLYTRESVMHDNDASRVPEAAMNRLNDARRIPNKQTNRHSISEKLHHYERRGNVKNSDIVDRRQSFPNILEKSGVVSASLQIPVSVAQPGLVKFAAGSSQDKQQLMLSSEQSVNDLKEVYNSSQGTPKTVITTITSSYDYSEIPYIEGTITSPELEILNQYSPISGSLSFSPKVDVSANDCRQVQFSQQKQQQPHHQKWLNRTSRLRMNSSSQPCLTIATPFSISEIDAPSSVVMGGAKVATCDQHLIKKSGSNEPKLPPSISSIGSAILRSKTADFERMSLKNQQRQVQPTTFNITTTTAPTTMISTTTTTARPHLYKRQELIPSAKRGNARK